MCKCTFLPSLPTFLLHAFIVLHTLILAAYFNSHILGIQCKDALFYYKHIGKNLHFLLDSQFFLLLTVTQRPNILQ